MNKKLCSMILAIMLLTSLVYAGNMPGYMTPDQKDALDGANAPSATNVLATEADVAAADTGVQTVTPGVNLSNSGDADNPILDLNISENVDMDTNQLTNLKVPSADGMAIRQTSKITEVKLEDADDKKHIQGTDTTMGTMTDNIDFNSTYQVINLRAPVADGEAIRQTAKIDESKLESLYDNRVETYTAPLGKSSQTVAMTNVNNTDTDGYLTHEQFAILENKYTQAQIAAYLLAKMDLADTDIFALVSGARAFTGQQDFQAGIQSDTIVESTVDAGVTIEGTKLKDNDIETGRIEVDEDAGATTLVDRSVSATPGAGVEQSDAFLIDDLWVAKSYAEADGSGSVKNRKWKMYSAYIEPLAIADSPINPVEGDLWFESTAADSGLNIYWSGAWYRVDLTAR